MNEPHLHLASSSPRRREILDSLGIRFTYAGVDIDESRQKKETAKDMVLRLAREKALTANTGKSVELPVLGADTVVVLGNRVFGKPASKEDGLAMLEALSGRMHRVLTAVAVRRGKRLNTTVSDTKVRFRDISRDEALSYWHSGEPEGKAGGYAIQGIGGMFVEYTEGSYSGVVGLPVFETAELLREIGINVLPTNQES